MRTAYRIDDYQDCYFVIDSFERLFEATRPDFAPYYEALARLPDIGTYLFGACYERPGHQLPTTLRAMSVPTQLLGA